MVPEAARMHFVVMSLLDADEDTTLAACIDEKRAFLKAACAGGGADRYLAFLAALESFVLHLDEEEGCREANVEAFDQSLRLCWVRLPTIELASLRHAPHRSFHILCRCQC